MAALINLINNTSNPVTSLHLGNIEIESNQLSLLSESLSSSFSNIRELYLFDTGLNMPDLEVLTTGLRNARLDSLSLMVK